jgi:nitroreductase
MMDAFENILSRHSWTKVRPVTVPRELIEKLLTAAVQAPNHHRNRPWRFFVMTGEARVRLGEAMAQALKQRESDSSEADLEMERAKPLRAPVVIAVGSDRPSEPRVLDVENLAATAAAVENLLLAAHASGLGAIWRTGAAAYDPAVKAFFGLTSDQHLVGFIYIGYPEPMPRLPDRPSFEAYTTWMA